MPRLESWRPRGGRGCCDLDQLVDGIVYFVVVALAAAAGPRSQYNSPPF